MNTANDERDSNGKLIWDGIWPSDVYAGRRPTARYVRNQRHVQFLGAITHDGRVDFWLMPSMPQGIANV